MTDTMTTMTRDGHGPMSNVELDPLVAAATSGDEAAFATLVERHRRELHVHCYRMVGSFEEAEDLVQETFLRAWRKRASFEGGAGFRAWLYRIATNASLDAIRLRSRRVASPGSFAEVPWLQPYPDQLLDEIAPSDDEPDAVVVARETIELTFLAVIQLLPPQQRAVLILRDVLDWSAAEAAALLDTSVAAANSALQRARATLREQLPQRPAERPVSEDLTTDERALLQGFMETHENGDTAAAAALLRDDVRVTMPPHPWLYEGREAIMPLMASAGEMGDWRLVATRANRQPAAASYLRRPGDSVYRAFKLDVLRVEDGAIAEITTFHSDLFAAFGLAETL
jgi:RNA polymerase sigma-70 factor (TIGR02960 family)